MLSAILGAKHFCGEEIAACGLVFARQTPEVVLAVPRAVSRAGTEPRQALKPSFLPVSANICLKYLYTSAQIFAKTA